MFPEPGHGAWNAALGILEFPLLTIVRVNDPFPPFYGWVMIPNSLVWAGLATLVVHLLRRRPARREELGALG